MLGTQISDPDGIEGPAGAVPGLGLLDVETVLEGDKVLVDIDGESADGAAAFKGYEMHIGRTTGAGCAKPLLRFADGREEGAVDDSGRIAGCYVHGLVSDARPPSGRRWSVWRITSSDISTATVCLSWRACPSSQQRHSRGQSSNARQLDRACDPVLPESCANVRGASSFAAIADPMVVAHRSLIGTRSGQPHTQRSSHCNLWPSHIRRAR